MTIDNRKERLLAEARKAEVLAAKAASPEIRESWLKIAAGYRQLAEDAPAA